MGRILLSICVVVVALGLGASAQKGPERQQPTQQWQPTSDQSAQIAPVRPVVAERQREPGEDQGEAAREANDIAERDLDAQQAMAWIAGLQILLTGAGIWYIRKTLLATEKAVGETATATTAMLAANEIAKEQMKAAAIGSEIELRPWFAISVAAGSLSLSETADGRENYRFECEVTLQNLGKTVAKNLWFKVFPIFVGPNAVGAIREAREAQVFGRSPGNDFALMPGDRLSMPWHISGSVDDLPWVAENDGRESVSLVVVVSAAYWFGLGDTMGTTERDFWVQFGGNDPRNKVFRGLMHWPEGTLRTHAGLYKAT